MSSVQSLPSPIRLKLPSSITSLCYNADGTRLAIGQSSRSRRHPTLTWLNPLAPKQAQVLRYSGDKNGPDYGDGGIDGVLVYDDKLFFIEMKSSTGGHLFYQRWDPATGQTETLLTRSSWTRTYLMPHQGPLLVLPALPVPSHIPDKTALPAALYDLRPPHLLSNLPVLPSWRWQVDDARHLLALADEQPLVRRYERDTWTITQEYHLLTEQTNHPPAVAYTSAHYCYAIGNPAAGIYVWDKLTGQPLPQLIPLRAQVVFSASLSHNETMLAIGGREWLTVYSVSSGQCLYRERLHRGRIQALAFSSDDTYLASGAELGDLCISELTPLML